MTQTPSSLFLCGCGWLGKYAVEAWQGRYRLCATSRDETKVEALGQQSIHARCFTLGDPHSELLSLARESTMILNIPAGRRAESHNEYVRQMLMLVDGLVQSPPPHLIFVSSTSVYGEHVSGDILETSAVAPDTGSARANAAIEAHIRSQYPFPFTILRLAGLIGPDRHPVTSLQGKALSNADSPVNLVHVDDVVRALERLHIMGGVNRTLHLCCREHPSRQAYYTWAAQQRGLTPPTFSSSNDHRVGKRINADKSWQYLQIEPAYPSPFSM